MVEKVHQHIIEELKTNTRTDTIFILSSIFLNFLMLAINSAIVAGNGDGANLAMFGLFILLTVVVNVVALVGLSKGRETRAKLVAGLVAMYEDHGVSKYYDRRLILAYAMRYRLFMLVVLASGVVALAVPFLVG